MNLSTDISQEQKVVVDECVVAIYATPDKAQAAIQRLTVDGFPSAQVSLVALGLKDDLSKLEGLKLEDDSLYDAAVGAGLGGVLGTLTGLSVLVLSGLGAVFIMGPIGGGILGTMAGAYIGTMAGWGVHKHKLEHYQRLIEAGHAMVIAIGDPLQLAQAYRLLADTEPSEVHTYARTGDDSPETA